MLRLFKNSQAAQAASFPDHFDLSHPEHLATLKLKFWRHLGSTWCGLQKQSSAYVSYTDIS
jgi:hypothetical protein